MYKITRRNLKKEIKRRKTPALLCFWADSGVSSFLYQETIKSLNNRIEIYTGDKKLQKKYNIKFLPTALVIKNNEVTDRIIGNVGKENFLQIIMQNEECKNN